MSRKFKVNNIEVEDVRFDGKSYEKKAETVKDEENNVEEDEMKNEGPALTEQRDMSSSGMATTSTPVVVETPGHDFPEGEVDRLLAALRSLCTESNTDTVLRCRGKELRYHAAMLRARCPFLSRLLEGRGDVDLDLEPSAVEAVVTYLYLGHLDNLPQGVNLGQVVEAAARLEVLALLGSCAQLLDNVEVREALEVLVVAETLGLEEVVGAAVARVLREGVVVARDPGLRSMVLEHPRALLRLYGAMWKEEEGAGELRACYNCGACSTGLYCTWCST